METYACIYPDTVVVHFFTAGIAEAAVFRAGWLWDLAGFTPVLIVVYNFVAWETLKSAFEFLLITICFP